MAVEQCIIRDTVWLPNQHHQKLRYLEHEIPPELCQIDINLMKSKLPLWRRNHYSQKFRADPAQIIPGVGLLKYISIEGDKFAEQLR